MVPLLLELPTEAPRRDPSPEPVVLTVGRIVPNKRLEDVVKAFTLYQRHHAPEASLVIVGSDLGFENYRQALHVLIARTGARNVHFTGKISAEARNALYLRADVYLSMSAHEGFCAPLIEALAHGVPVVARSAGAVPETLGGAGLVLDGADCPWSRRRCTSSPHRGRHEARSTTPPTGGSRNFGPTCSCHVSARRSAHCWTVTNRTSSPDTRGPPTSPIRSPVRRNHGTSFRLAGPTAALGVLERDRRRACRQRTRR